MSSCGWPRDYMFYAWCVNVMQSVPGCGTVCRRWIVIALYPIDIRTGYVFYEHLLLLLGSTGLWHYILASLAEEIPDCRDRRILHSDWKSTNSAVILSFSRVKLLIAVSCSGFNVARPSFSLLYVIVASIASFVGVSMHTSKRTSKTAKRYLR